MSQDLEIRVFMPTLDALKLCLQTYQLQERRELTSIHGVNTIPRMAGILYSGVCYNEQF